MAKKFEVKLGENDLIIETSIKLSLALQEFRRSEKDEDYSEL